MIQPVENIKDIIKILRNTVIEQANLDGKFVLNALSVRGAMLNKSTEQQIYQTFERTDLFILFALIEHETSDNVTIDNDDKTGSIRYVSYQFNLSIYGEAAGMTVQLLQTRLLSNEVRVSLYNQGIKLQNIDEPTSSNEFINNTLWLRKDMSINIAVRLDFKDILTSEPFEQLNDTCDIRTT